MTPPPVLTARDVHKSFRLGSRDIPVLRGIDLELAQGETVALLGASGAGKSTLLHLLGLLDRPTAGEILFDGSRVDDLRGWQRARLRHRQIGFVFQFYHLIPELSAIQNVQLGALMDLGLGAWLGERRAIRERAQALLADVGLADRARHRPNELSGGERQRVAIARALIAEPRVILADEPTGNLDSETAAGVLELLFRINRERSISFFLVTHDAGLAARCDRVVRIRDGRILDGRIPDGRIPDGRIPDDNPAAAAARPADTGS
ncbi:MAG: ABC transporter ATP-binding protein [Planctomycetes bacterium]|nr:ABC transporter ATP-binding protein [Planctomycetota bacterium]